MKRLSCRRNDYRELIDDDGEPIFCDNPHCEFPAIEMVHVSEVHANDSRRSYCASCLAIYEVGVQHGRLVASRRRATRVVCRYRYTALGSTLPLLRCPSCGVSWTDKGSVDLVLSLGDRIVEVPSRLDAKGWLEDTEDGAVAKGFHSSTCCGRCGKVLNELACEHFVKKGDPS